MPNSRLVREFEIAGKVGTVFPLAGVAPELVCSPHPNPCMFKVTSVTRLRVGKLSLCFYLMPQPVYPPGHQARGRAHGVASVFL